MTPIKTFCFVNVPFFEVNNAILLNLRNQTPNHSDIDPNTDKVIEIT